ncbi:Glucose/arabinose dehydrogenase, beta-propeller fold [Sphingomonas guangdongensis]|uniref:Glucose/arabinose dehydrogenase, beta-propeller fold n=1 Tax=Sphingomonas guangdongensis TaxID=1141890 RepID=A0A285QGM8_9SPHN|nr:sorbosone dehydrogenase family protein [Sphingomonas guangdongensis]SOB80634.1 Glucose/arabinose dehydrogenase, beta-propeller fold [Sphingomonas guangdongensis]
MRRYILIALGLVILAAAGVYFYLKQPDRARLPEAAVMGVRPTISAPRRQFFPTIGIADVVGWQNGAKPLAAAGLQVAAFAEGLDHPRWLYRLPNGDVLVAESNSPPREGGGITGWVMKKLMGRAGAGVPSANRITLLRDANGDGVAEVRQPFLTGLNSPFGMALVGPWLYVANTDALVRVPYAAGQTRITARPEKVVDLPGGGNHWARNVIAAPGGRTLYVTVGSASNIAENGLDAERRRANILEVFPERKYARIYAAGLRNPNGLAIEPRSNRLWTVVNERDMLGSDLPPDYMAAVDLGDNFGWPWYYWGGYPDKRVEPANPGLQEYSKRPDYALGAHSASLGLAFAGDARLGARFADGAFVSQHGSWNREPPAGYRVLYVPFGSNGFPDPRVNPTVVLHGFLDREGRAQGRPVGVITDQSGALLVADDVGNKIWRVAAR